MAPTIQQKNYLLNPVKEYRRLSRFLVTVVFTHWDKLGNLSNDNIVPAVEKLVHQTASNPHPKYPQITLAFHKFPSYLRRAAIMFAVGQVSSCWTRYCDWQSLTANNFDSATLLFFLANRRIFRNLKDIGLGIRRLSLSIRYYQESTSIGKTVNNIAIV